MSRIFPRAGSSYIVVCEIEHKLLGKNILNNGLLEGLIGPLGFVELTSTSSLENFNFSRKGKQKLLRELAAKRTTPWHHAPIERCQMLASGPAWMLLKSDDLGTRC